MSPRFGRGVYRRGRTGPLFFFVFLLPLWMMVGLIALFLTLLKSLTHALAQAHVEHRRLKLSSSHRVAVARAFARDAVTVDMGTVERDRLDVWAVYGIADRFYAGRFPSEGARLARLYPDHVEFATMGLYPNAGSARKVASAMRRHRFTVDELKAIAATGVVAGTDDGAAVTPQKQLPDSRPAADQSSGKTKMRDFVVGQEYTMKVVQAVLGGDTMSYLPQVGGRIVFGRFTTDMNPEAPEKVLVGDRPQVKRKAELLARQGGVLPVFMKIEPGRWRYHGLMEFVEYVTDMAVVEPKAAKAGRSGEVIGMLVFRPID